MGEVELWWTGAEILGASINDGEGATVEEREAATGVAWFG